MISEVKDVNVLILRTSFEYIITACFDLVQPGILDVFNAFPRSYSPVYSLNFLVRASISGAVASFAPSSTIGEHALLVKW